MRFERKNVKLQGGVAAVSLCLSRSSGFAASEMWQAVSIEHGLRTDFSIRRRRASPLS